jgi:hypothetical protein
MSLPNAALRFIWSRAGLDRALELKKSQRRGSKVKQKFNLAMVGIALFLRL